MGTKVVQYDLPKLVKFIETKHIAVPEFQRGFVWKTVQVKKLFDSLINQYPVGSFILWATNKNIDARTLDGEKLPKKKFLILDGQQRLASIYYLCRQQKFLEVKDKFHENCDNRPRDVIEFEKFFISKGENGPVLEYGRDSSRKFDVGKFRRRVKKGYRFPIITVSLDSYRRAIEIFERINQAGTRISTESIFLSETWGTHSNIAKILRGWKRKNKGSLTRGIDTVIFIHVFALILQLGKKKNTEKIDISIKTLKKIADEIRGVSGEEYNRLFEASVKSVARAVEHLKEEYRVFSLGELPSQTMITVLAVFFYYQRKSLSKIQLSELRKWFWRSSLSNRYIGSGYSQHVDVDVRKMCDLAKKNTKLHIPRTSKIFAKLQGVDLRAGRSTYRNLVKQALWQQQPIFINGSEVNRSDVESGQHKPEDDHFFPYDLMRKGVAGQEINNILNVHFLNKDENIRKGKQPPSRWLEERIQETGATPSDMKKYFESELLPFKDVKALKKYEKYFKLKGRAQRMEFARRYKRFVYKRFKLFEKVLIRLQNGHLR
jgi:hypothetical protein